MQCERPGCDDQATEIEELMLSTPRVTELALCAEHAAELRAAQRAVRGP